MALLTEPIKIKDITISEWENPDFIYAMRLVLAEPSNKFTPIEAKSFLAQERTKFYLIERLDGDLLIKIGFLFFVYERGLGGYLLHYFRDEVALKNRNLEIMATLKGANKIIEHFFDCYHEQGLFLTQHVFNHGSIALCKRLGFTMINQMLTPTGLLNLWARGK